MTCDACGQETTGVKLNGKLYCSNCGSLLEQKASPLKTTIEEAAPVEVQEAAPELQEEVSQATIASEPNEDTNAPDAVDRATEDVLVSLDKKLSALSALFPQKEVAKDEPKPEPKPVRVEKITLPPEKPEPKAKKTEKALDELPTLKPKFSIIKHGRPVVAKVRRNDFLRLPNEPDPIAEPELGVPHDDLITQGNTDYAKADSEVKFDLTKEQPIEESAEALTEDNSREETAAPTNHSAINKGSFLTSFLKETATAKPTVTAKPQKNKKQKLNKKVIYIVLASLAALLTVIILVALYLHFYTAKPQVAKKVAETAAEFSHLKPNYIPAGYVLSGETKGNNNSITYVYRYLPDENKSYQIVAKKSDVTNTTFEDKIVKPAKLDFTSSTQTNGDIYWYLGERKLSFIHNGILYEISSNTDIFRDELTKIAAGLK